MQIIFMKISSNKSFGIVFCILANSIEKLSGQNNNLYKIFSTIMFVFVLKFVRSELAVVLKLYILPNLINRGYVKNIFPPSAAVNLIMKN